MEHPEGDHEKDETQQYAPGYAPEVAGKDIASQFNVVPNVRGESHDHTVEKQDTPIRKCLVRKIPINYLAKQIHNVSVKHPSHTRNRKGLYYNILQR